MAKANIVSIDAWNGPDGWTWNNSFQLSDVESKDIDKLKTPRKVCAYLRKLGYLKAESAGKVQVDYSGSDPDCIEIKDKSSGEPVLAIWVDWAAE